ncbi:ScbA/BarX family gamma-butyrolactone biosynthesis protein [Streptomyces sp. PU-14G]|uniref:ScbA/BarX family gamma-butyrolactone biosynthesis protein n=1 Tax=Streptomyces sp. PU-14G TaxID=2800808 RepID=UPI0034DE75B9
MTLPEAQKEDLRTVGSPREDHRVRGQLPQLTTTVPREYVHRASLAEVFLTGCEKINDNLFSLTGQWPRAHTFFNSPDGRQHSPLQAAETIRQTGLYLAHSEFGVPLGYHFVMRDLSLLTEPDHLEIGRVPSELTLSAVCLDLRWKGTRLAEFDMDITIFRYGRQAARGGGRFSCVSDAAYKRLRRRQTHSEGEAAPAPAAPVARERAAPSVVGRALPSDVVLSPAGRAGRWLLAPDPDHPILFDHSGDHMPGMVLMEAAQQAARALLAPGNTLVLESMSTHFCRYAELDRPCWIQAHLLSVQQSRKLTVHITGHQNGEEIFLAQVQGSVTAS